MPYSVDEKHSPSEFYYPGETNYPNAMFQGEDNAEQNATKTAKKKYFLVFSTNFRKNCDSTKPYNKSLINLVCSVCTGKYCLRFLSHRPRSFVARSVRKTSGNTFPYRPRTRLILSPYSFVYEDEDEGGNGQLDVENEETESCDQGELQGLPTTPARQTTHAKPHVSIYVFLVYGYF